MIGVDNTTGKHLDGIEHLKQSIMDILLTPLGTRVMRRDYGSRLFDLIDAPINEGTIIDIVAATAEALAKWEPRIEVERVVLGDSGNTISESGIEQLRASMAQGRIGLTLYGKYLPDGKAITLDYSNLPLISGTVKRAVTTVILPPEEEPGIVSLGGAAGAIATATGELGLVNVSEITFYGGFDLGEVCGLGTGGNHNWFNQQTTTNASISVQSSSISAYCGKFTVAPSGGGSERAEVLEYQDASGDVVYENITSGTQVYRFSTMFDNSWQPITSTDGNGRWCIILQLHHGTQPFNPALGIDVSGDSGYELSLFTKGGNQDTVTSDTKSVMSDQTLPKSVWIDWILTVKYATDNTGFARLDRKNPGASGYTRVAAIENVPTLQWNNAYPTAGDHYMKMGIYRGAGDSSTSIIYHDNFTREQG